VLAQSFFQTVSTVVAVVAAQRPRPLGYIEEYQMSLTCPNSPYRLVFSLKIYLRFWSQKKSTSTVTHVIMGGGHENIGLRIVQDETGAWVYVPDEPISEPEPAPPTPEPVPEPEPAPPAPEEEDDVPVPRATALIEEALNAQAAEAGAPTPENPAEPAEVEV
jgi:hypothetical protein